MNYTVGNFGKILILYLLSKTWERMELPIKQCRSSLQGCVDPRLTVGTMWWVPRVDNTDDRQTAAAGQHWTGKPLKHKLSSLLSDLCCTTIKCYSIEKRYCISTGRLL